MSALFALGLPSASPIHGGEPKPGAGSYAALGDELVETVRTLFYDPARGAAWAEANAGYARAVGDAASFARATNERLARLGASHTHYYTPDDFGYADLLSIFEPVYGKKVEVDSLGLGLVPRDGGWYVARVFAGGAAAATGLRRGDRLATLNGAPFDPVRALRGRAGTAVFLGVERRPDAPLLEVEVTPRKVDPKAEWLDSLRQGTKVVARGGLNIGYVPVWSCAGEPVQEAITEQVNGPLAATEALVLDLRAGWGGCNPQLVQLFVSAPPRLEAIDRDGHRSLFPPVWERPLVVLIDDGSRSGKEVVARTLQRLGRATLVGERTAGAVLAGRFNPLSDGSLLYLAVQDVRVDGERLEGVGVTPDLAVPGDLPFAAGSDPQLDAALDRAAALAAGKKSG